MKIHYKGKVITQAWIPANYSSIWPYGNKKGRLGYGVEGVCIPDLRSLDEAIEMIEKLILGEIKI